MYPGYKTSANVVPKTNSESMFSIASLILNRNFVNALLGELQLDTANNDSPDTDEEETPMSLKGKLVGITCLYHRKSKNLCQSYKRSSIHIR